MHIEKRKHTRLLLQGNIFAAIGLEFTKIGKVKNISLGGLAIEYIPGEDKNHNPSILDIFLTGSAFQLADIPCKQIYDIEVHLPHVKSPYIEILTTKRCGVQFEELTLDDVTELEAFLKTHANDLA